MTAFTGDKCIEGIEEGLSMSGVFMSLSLAGKLVGYKEYTMKVQPNCIWILRGGIDPSRYAPVTSG